VSGAPARDGRVPAPSARAGARAVLGAGRGRRALAAVAALVLSFEGGARVARAMQGPRDPTRLTGADWMAFGAREKDAYLSGFIAGAAAEQARAAAAAAGDTADSSAVSLAAIGRLRDGRRLRFSYAPSVYAAQIDDFYWWVDHRDAAIVDVMITINHRMKDQ